MRVEPEHGGAHVCNRPVPTPVGSGISSGNQRSLRTSDPMSPIAAGRRTPGRAHTSNNSRLAPHKEPVDELAASDVDDEDAEVRFHPPRLERIVELESRVDVTPTGLGGADDCVVVREAQAAEEAGSEGDRLEGASGDVDCAQLARPCVCHPQPAVPPSGRVRHGQAVGHHLTAGHVDHDALVPPSASPTVHFGRRADTGHIAGDAVHHCQAVEMAPIARLGSGQEWRAPSGHEAHLVAARGQAAKACVHPEVTAIGLDADVVDVDVAHRRHVPRHEQPIVASVGRGPGSQDVLEAPDLESRPSHSRSVPSAAIPMTLSSVRSKTASRPSSSTPNSQSLAGGVPKTRLTSWPASHSARPSEAISWTSS